MRILISGSSGLLGSALVRKLSGGGHTVVRLVRSGGDAQDVVRWDIADGTIDRDSLEGFDAVVHLAGENLASGRWTSARRRSIRESRTRGTRLLARTLAELDHPPHVFVSASAVGIYGDSGETVLTEDAPAGNGFLADVCRDWEEAAVPAREAGIRTVHPRFGVVLSSDGGALRKMLTPFRLGLGGRIGLGDQYLAWIAIDDAVAAIEHVISSGSLSGPANVTSPNPVTNREFTQAIARALHRPARIPIPAFALKLALGEMAEETLLASQRAIPAKLLADGFGFRLPTLREALAAIL